MLHGNTSKVSFSHNLVDLELLVTAQLRDSKKLYN